MGRYAAYVAIIAATTLLLLEDSDEEGQVRERTKFDKMSLINKFVYVFVYLHY